MVTFHPCGFTHGPHPKALKNAFKSAKPATDEYAVMIDARDALQVGDAASARRMARLCRQLEGARRHEARDPQDRQPRRPRCIWSAATSPAASPRAPPPRCSRRSTTGRRSRRCCATKRVALEAGEWLGVDEFAGRGMRGAPAARLSMGGRLGLRESRRAGAQGARRGDAAQLLDRSADVSGRLRLVPRPARSDPDGRRSLGHRFRGRDRGHHRRRADGRRRRGGARATSSSSCWSTTCRCATSSRPSWPRASASSSPSRAAPSRRSR